jgi:hypothetical protein
MDLRSYSATNTGYIHELRHLAPNIPFDRCLLIVDETTDGPFLERTLKEAWEHLSPGSPNYRQSPDEATLHRFESGTVVLLRLLRSISIPVRP